MGQDWGWNNPSATLAFVLDDRDILYIIREVYGSNMTMEGPTSGLSMEQRDNDVVCRAVELARSLHRTYGLAVERVWCDPSEPRNIEKFIRADLVARRANNSLEAGIAAVNTRIRAGRLKVFNTCKNLIKELGMYRYPTPEEQKIVGEKPFDNNNHACSAVRYVIHELDRFRKIEPGSSPYLALPQKADPKPPVDYETDYQQSPPQQRYSSPKPSPEDAEQGKDGARSTSRSDDSASIFRTACQPATAMAVFTTGTTPGSSPEQPALATLWLNHRRTDTFLSSAATIPESASSSWGMGECKPSQ